MQNHRQPIITDLDQSDEAVELLEEDPGDDDQLNRSRRMSKKRVKEKVLQTISGNFTRRSKSCECHPEKRVVTVDELTRSTRATNYFHELLQSKDKQMETLLQRLSKVHLYNERFNKENQRLQNELKCLEGRVTELQYEIAHCKKCEQYEMKLLQESETNKILTADVEMMKTLTYRLNVQIERYQDKLREHDQQPQQPQQPQLPQQHCDGMAFRRQTSGDSGHNTQLLNAGKPISSSIVSWSEGSLCSHTLAPLLQAYDEMLHEKEELIQEYSRHFENFSGDLKRIVEENTRLQQQMDVMRREGGNWKDERTRLQAQVDVCRQKAEAQAHKTELAKEKLLEVMHCYEQRVQNMSLDLEHLQSAYTRCKAELASMKSLATMPQESITVSLQECKTLLEQLRQQHQKEKQNFEQKIGELSKRNCGIGCNIQRLKDENSTLKSKLKQAETSVEEERRKYEVLQRSHEKLKRSRDSLKARLRIALQWAQKLEEGQSNLQNTWDALKRLETIVKHKESQVRGLHNRHMEELDQMEQKLAQKNETIRRILSDKLKLQETT